MRSGILTSFEVQIDLNLVPEYFFLKQKGINILSFIQIQTL
jgi:hypothetical protein